MQVATLRLHILWSITADFPKQMPEHVPKLSRVKKCTLELGAGGKMPAVLGLYIIRVLFFIRSCMSIWNRLARTLNKREVGEEQSNVNVLDVHRIICGLKNNNKLD